MKASPLDSQPWQDLFKKIRSTQGRDVFDFVVFQKHFLSYLKGQLRVFRDSESQAREHCFIRDPEVYRVKPLDVVLSLRRPAEGH